MVPDDVLSLQKQQEHGLVAQEQNVIGRLGPVLESIVAHGGEADTEGCLVTESNLADVWIVHQDGTRNWISAPATGCKTKALIVTNVGVYAKRYDGRGEYNLDSTESATACQQSACEAWPLPIFPHMGPLGFIVRRDAILNINT